MSLFSAKLGGLAVASVLAATGSYWIYDRNSPKDLDSFFRRQGQKVATEELAFKAIFSESKDEIQGENISDASALKTWCEATLKLRPSSVSSDIKTKASKFCIENIRTVRGAIIRKGMELISGEGQDSDYKVVFALYRGDQKFTGWLKETTSNTSISEGYEKLKKKCQENLDVELNKGRASGISETSWWCVVPGERTIDELLKKEKLSILENQENQWEKQFETWKNTAAIIEALKKHDPSGNKDLDKDTDKVQAAPKLQKWCSDSISKNLGDDDVYPTLYSQIKSVCTNYRSKK